VRETKPRVFLVAETKLYRAPTSGTDVPDMRDYLGHVGAPDWETDSRTDAELLIEAAGRLCYKSWKPGLNPNVTRVREGNREYVGNLIAQRHGSVLEHAQVTFVFADVSRVFTHELVRHRAGCAYSQESLRYVRLDDLGFRIPGCLEPLREHVNDLMLRMENFQKHAAVTLEVSELPFSVKKVITSAMRRLAPLGLSTHIMWSVNLRALRHVIAQRTAEGAEEEMRTVFDEVARIAKRRWPAVFQDFERQEPEGSWRSTAGGEKV